MSGGARNVVLLSAFHDYRTAKRGSIQQVADGLVRAGNTVSFVSTRFSRISRVTGDSRLGLWARSNRVETVNGIRCYLARTLLHPFQSRNRLVNAAMARLYPAYAALPDARLDAFFRAADVVVIESSAAAIYIRRIKRLNPAATIIYYGTDRLDTVGAHDFIRQRLEQDAGLIDHVCLRSPKMAAAFGWAKGKLFRAEFGIEPDDYATIGPSPYPPETRTAVAVGSMLFDPGLIQAAAQLRPDIQFHVIGCGTRFEAPPNVHIHAEMKFVDTLPFVKHATVGVAPYRPAPGAEYLAESSLKIAQYEFFGLPVLCPDFATGGVAGRFGYQPGHELSIRDALLGALAAAGTLPRRSFLTWDEVAERVLEPQRFPGTALS